MLPAIIVVNLFGSTDFAQIFTSLLCLLFYGAAVSALSTLIQSIVENKLSSFVISALILAIFNSAHLFSVYFSLPDFLSTLSRLLSFAWHFDSAGKGISDTRDLIWLSGSTALFIFAASYITEKKKGRHFSKNQKFKFYILQIIILLLMLNGNRWYTRIDFSRNKTYSISRYTKSLAEHISSPVKISYYRSSSIAKLYPQIRDVTDFLNEYAAINPNISLLIKDPDKDSSLKEMLENYGIASQQLRTVSASSTEFITVYSAIIIEYEGNSETIPFTMSASTLEYDLDGRLRHLISGSRRVVNLVIGNGMSLTEDYGYLLPWLQSQGFECRPISLNSPLFVSQLAGSTGPLLITGDSQIKIEEAIAIEDYILSGKGGAFFAISPFVTDIDNSWAIKSAERTNLVELVEHWGVKFDDSIAADLSCARITMYSDDNNQTKLLNYPLWVSLLQQQNCPLGMTLFWACPLKIESENDFIKPYLITSPAAWINKIDRDSPDKLIETNPFVLENSNSASDIAQQKGSLILAAEITGPLQGLYNLSSCKDSHIIVISDQYFVNSLMTGYIGGDNGDYRNFEFLTNCLLKLNGEEELALLQSKTARDTSLYKITDADKFNSLRLLSLILLFILLPLSIIAAGVILNVKNK